MADQCTNNSESAQANKIVGVLFTSCSIAFACSIAFEYI